jgi:uncharacterized protein GlcG (DUF336 family)
MKLRSLIIALTMMSGSFGQIMAETPALITVRLLAPETALQLAQVAMNACREMGSQVAVTVVDRMGVQQVMLRDRFAGPHTPETSWSKAKTAVSFRRDTLSMQDVTRPEAPRYGARFIPGAMMLGGGVPVEAGGFIVGGVGVSGGPDGKTDDACARAGIEAIVEKLEF